MDIKQVTENKKAYLDLLLLGDEQEDMIDKYLDRGMMFIIEEEDGVKAECVVTGEGSGVLELKNIATVPACQGKGYGKSLIQFIEQHFGGQFRVLQAGTGDSPLTIPFYQKCGFIESHRIKNFFTENYDHPIIEGGKLLTDMVYLKKDIGKT